MSSLNTVTPENAQGQVKEIYDQIAATFGSIPNAMQAYSSSPALLASQWQNIGYFMQHPSLSFNLLAMIRMLVSMSTRCEYCVGFNEAMLINMGGLTLEQVAATKNNPHDAPLSAKDKAMLLFVVKATADSLAVNHADIADLKTQGWSDGEILDALAHGAYMLAGDTILNVMKIERDF